MLSFYMAQQMQPPHDGCRSRDEAPLHTQERLEDVILLQEDLESARQQLHHAEQESKVLVAAQLSEHEASWKSRLHDSHLKLQQAHNQTAVGSADSSPQLCHLIADCDVAVQ